MFELEVSKSFISALFGRFCLLISNDCEERNQKNFSSRCANETISYFLLLNFFQIGIFNCLKQFVLRNCEYIFEPVKRRIEEATIPLLVATVTLLSCIIKSDESVPELIGTQSDIFELLATGFDMVNPDAQDESEKLTVGLLEVFIGLAKSTNNQSEISKVQAILSSILTLAQERVPFINTKVDCSEIS
jgi:hypothetical protein